MTTAATPFMALSLELPWTVNQDNDQRFIRVLRNIGIALLILFIVVPFLPRWEVDFAALEQQPVVRTQVMLEPPKMPEVAKPVDETPPPPPQPKPRKEKPVTAAERPQPKSGSQAPAQALAALSSLNAMKTKVDVSKLQNKNLAVTGGQAKAETRSSLGQDNLATSGGLKNSDMNMAVKGAALGSHQGTAVDSPIAYLDLPDEGGAYSEGARGRRDMESIRRTIENTKGTVYALYAKALRQYPDLAGKFVFELVVEPDGTVSRLKLLNSDLGMPDLEQKMLAKVSAMNFGADKVAPTRVQYTFVLIPS
ncbi:AgmX/PglI C-terminal domain-containing protein [Thalassolituus sp. LLYu03]|uniref:AgmX/PglI C-terminal domain-containing protein n=1 Tax=Thalassolituus sp. LLYu03 TaxID=3421656 RepID=UPI003D266D02